MALSTSPANPRYFQTAGGQIVYLAGWYDNFSPQSGGNWALVLSNLSAYGLNCARLWVRHHEEVVPVTYTKTGGLYDLDTPNPAYLTALRSSCEDLAARSAYAIVMLFQGWSLIDNGFGNMFLTCPFRSTMNSDSVNGDWYNSDTYGTEVDEVRDANNANEIAIRSKQRIWIRAVIDTLNDLDNIIWEVSNEDRFNTSNQAWQEWVANEIRTYEATKAKQHPVGMSSTYNGTTSVNPWLKSTTADWIGPNHSTGNYDTAPEVNTGGKVVLADTDHIWGSYVASADWVWKTALRGHNPLPITGRSSGDVAVQRALGNTISYMNRLTLANVAPSSEMSTTGYCMAWVANEYLVYAPTAAAFTVNLTANTYNYEWFNTATGIVHSSGVVVAPGGLYGFTPPVAGAVLLLTVPSAPTIEYATGKFSYTYVHTGGPVPTAFRIKWGVDPTNPTNYTQSHAIAAASYTGNVLINTVLPGNGWYHSAIVATDGVVEWGLSVDRAFNVINATPPVVDPTCVITMPTTAATYDTPLPSITLAGTATPSTAPGATLTSVQYMNDETGFIGTAIGTTAWTTHAIPLVEGVNHVSVWATSSDGRIGGDALAVTYTLVVPQGTCTLELSN